MNRDREEKKEQFAAWGREVMQDEAASILAAVKRIDGRFGEAVDLIRNCRGKVVVSGLGKSGHVGAKIAATLSSLGTPAVFLHAAEAVHGDVGLLRAGDVVIAISYSGETDELIRAAKIARSMDIPIIAMTMKKSSALGKMAAAWLDVSVTRESDPWNAAPTASSTLALAMGDALAVAVARARGFALNDFARCHPGGALGKSVKKRI